MKIGVDCRELRSYRTGIGRILLELLRQAKAYQKDFVFILFGNQRTNFLSSPDVFEDYEKVIIKEKWTLWWDQIQLKNAIKRNKVDLFFSPYYKMPLMAKIKTVISVFDVTYLLVKPYSDYLRNRLYIKNFIKIAAKKAKKIITISNHTKNDLRTVLNLPEEKIEVSYPGISPEFRRVEDKKRIESLKKKYGIQKKYILYVGNFMPHKNLKSLIDAYHLLPDGLREEYLLVLCGGELGNLELSARKGKLSGLPSIISVGQVADEDLPSLYSRAELFVFPSLYEGFGFPPLEAMACGCPVASSHSSSLPEVLGDAAHFFNPYKIEEISRAMKLLLENEGLRESFRRKGLERAKLYTSKRMAEEFLSLFKSTLESQE